MPTSNRKRKPTNKSSYKLTHIGVALFGILLGVYIFTHVIPSRADDSSGQSPCGKFPGDKPAGGKFPGGKPPSGPPPSGVSLPPLSGIPNGYVPSPGCMGGGYATPTIDISVSPTASVSPSVTPTSDNNGNGSTSIWSMLLAFIMAFLSLLGFK